LSEINERLCRQWELHVQSHAGGLTIADIISLEEAAATVFEDQALDEYSDAESIRYVFHCLNSSSKNSVSIASKFSVLGSFRRSVIQFIPPTNPFELLHRF